LEKRNKVEHVVNTAFADQMSFVKNKTYPLAKDAAHMKCYEALMDSYEAKCGWSEYAFKFYGALLKECEVSNNKTDAIARIEKACEAQVNPFDVMQA